MKKNFISKLCKHLQEGNVMRNVINTSSLIFNKGNGKVNPLSCILEKVIWFDGVIHLMFNLWYKTDIVDHIHSLSHECYVEEHTGFDLFNVLWICEAAIHMGFYSGIYD